MMTKKELKNELEAMRRQARRILRSKKRAREFLMGTGIYTPKGNLRKVYR